MRESNILALRHAVTQRDPTVKNLLYPRYVKLGMHKQYGRLRVSRQSHLVISACIDDMVEEQQPG